MVAARTAASRVTSTRSCTQLGEQWLAAGGVKRLPLLLGTTAPGTYTLDGFRIAVGAWRVDATAATQRPNVPIEGLPPPACAISIKSK